MSRGKRALSAAAIALSLTVAASGCGLDRLDGMTRIPLEEGYVPLTRANFAEVTTEAMYLARTAHMEMEVDGGVTSMDLVLGASERELAMSGTYDDGETVGEMVLVDGEVYVRDEGDRIYYQFPDYLADEMFAEIGTGSPAAIVADFEEGIETLEAGLSHEVAYGTTHEYRVTMRKEFLADELDIPLEKVPDFRYRIWLDDDNLYRRVVVNVMGTELDMTYSDWGKEVSIEAPPPRLVEPLPVPSEDA